MKKLTNKTYINIKFVDDEECDHWRHAGKGDKWNPKEASGHWHSHDDGWWHSGKDEDDCQKKRPSNCECHTSTDWETTTDLRTTTAWFTKTKCQCSKTKKPTPSKIITTVYTDARTTATITNIKTILSTPNSKPTTNKSTSQQVNAPTQATKSTSSVKKATPLTKSNNATPSTQAATKNSSNSSTTVVLDSSEEVEETLPPKHVSSDIQSSTSLVVKSPSSRSQTQHSNSITSSITSSSVSMKISASTLIGSSALPSLKTPSSSLKETSTSSLMENSLISSIYQSVVSSPSPIPTTSTEISRIATALTTQLTKASATSKSITVRIFGSIRDDLSLDQRTETAVNSVSTNGEFIMATDSTFTSNGNTVSNSKMASESINGTRNRKLLNHDSETNLYIFSIP